MTLLLFGLGPVESMDNPFRTIARRVRRYLTRQAELRSDVGALRSIMIDEYIRANLHGSPRYQDPKRLNRHEYQVYSQNGEDGIIEEIFFRIGTSNRLFVEIGVQDGLECNSTYLLLKGWSGYWLEGNSDSVAAIQGRFSGPMGKHQLKVRKAFVTAENVEMMLKDEGVPTEFDLLSIDIDGNDYWVWKALDRFNPRVVAIEYNALFRHDVRWVMKYDPTHVWDGTSYFNSSLKSLELLGASKGYCLVGCNFHGVNAFFVRRDLVQEMFCAPFTAENHYEPIRYHLQKKDGFPREFGDFEEI
jgi:hypothetical protein